MAALKFHRGSVNGLKTLIEYIKYAEQRKHDLLHNLLADDMHGLLYGSPADFPQMMLTLTESFGDVKGCVRQSVYE